MSMDEDQIKGGYVKIQRGNVDSKKDAQSRVAERQAKAEEMADAQKYRNQQATAKQAGPKSNPLTDEQKKRIAERQAKANEMTDAQKYRDT